MTTEIPNISTPDDVDLLEIDQVRCPWKSYEVLREQAPVWHDPRTDIWVISRFEDIRRVLLDPETFPASVPAADDSHKPEIRALYEEKGMLPAKTMNAYDDPEHRQIRGPMDHAFRPRNIEKAGEYIKQVCDELIAGFIDQGQVEFMEAYGKPVALRTLCQIMGVPEEDGAQVDFWADAWVQRLSETMSPEQEIWSAEQEIEAQHYFQKIIDRLREHPDDSLISDIVNSVDADGAASLSDAQIHIEILVDMFVGGRAPAYSLAAAVMLFINDPELWETVRADPEKHLDVFIEEALRIDGPQQGNPRTTSRDVEVAGTVIPKGALINARWGAGNRDPRAFGEDADRINLDRRRPKAHLAFGIGQHRCIGSHLARAEMRHGLMALIDNVERMWLLDDPAKLDFHPSYILRGTETLNIGFEKKRR